MCRQNPSGNIIVDRRDETGLDTLRFENVLEQETRGGFAVHARYSDHSQLAAGMPVELAGQYRHDGARVLHHDLGGTMGRKTVTFADDRNSPRSIASLM